MEECGSCKRYSERERESVCVCQKYKTTQHVLTTFQRRTWLLCISRNSLLFAFNWRCVGGPNGTRSQWRLHSKRGRRGRLERGPMAPIHKLRLYIQYLSQLPHSSEQARLSLCTIHKSSGMLSILSRVLCSFIFLSDWLTWLSLSFLSYKLCKRGGEGERVSKIQNNTTHIDNIPEKNMITLYFYHVQKLTFASFKWWRVAKGPNGTRSQSQPMETT